MPVLLGSNDSGDEIKAQYDAHARLGAAGAIPILGAPADALDALIYLAEGDIGNAALSGAALLPGGSGAKTGIKITSGVVDGAKDARKVVNGAEAAAQGARNITNASQIDPNMLKNLKNEGTITTGGRSGGNRPLTGNPNSYVKTQAGHTLVYDDTGHLIYDISSERVKMTVWDQAPDSNLYPRDVKLEGPVPKELWEK